MVSDDASDEPRYFTFGNQPARPSRNRVLNQYLLEIDRAQ